MSARVITIGMPKPTANSAFAATSWATIRSPFEARDWIKETVPASHRRWDPLGKVWKVDIAFIPELTTSLEACGWTVRITGSSAASAARPDWIRGAFDSCTSTGQTEAMRKALLRVHHPDHGADPALVERIVALADQRRRELR